MISKNLYLIIYIQVFSRYLVNDTAKSVFITNDFKIDFFK